ncbi:hypothetical protein G9A89_016916 [Geosiphon pyriformis]|nr:hypothetical protein G9A89_016916 [Geosiphon pyriformis]
MSNSLHTNGPVSTSTSPSIVEERVVLNVGGVKYETYRATLTAYPHTRLGRLFKNKKKTPSNRDEHFFDRNGHAFHYILEYYRTGRITFPRDDVNSGGRGVALDREIFNELEYFEILPANIPHQNKALAIRIDQLVNFLRQTYFEAVSRMQLETDIRFHVDGTYFAPIDVNFCIGASGYVILERFGKDIESHLKSTIPLLKANFTHYPKGNTYPENRIVSMPHYQIQFFVETDNYDFDAVRKISSLKSRDP